MGFHSGVADDSGSGSKGVGVWTMTAGLSLLLHAIAPSERAFAQVRGVYPTGMNATNSGVTPAPGLTYSNLFIFNSRDERRGPEGEVLDTGQHALMIDLNTIAWVSPARLPGAATSRVGESLPRLQSLGHLVHHALQVPEIGKPASP